MPKSDGWKNLEKGRGWNKGKDSRVDIECILCGKSIKVYPSHLRGKKFCSVKCRNEGQSKGLTAPMRLGTGQPEYLNVWRRKYNNYKKDNLDISFDEYCNSIDKCYYCGDNTKESLGYDRINNDLGHIKENCIVCCELCNRTRGHAFSVKQMELLGEVIKQFDMNGWRVMNKKSIKKMMENENWKKSKFKKGHEYYGK